MHSQAAGSIPDPQITLQLAVQFETEYIVSVRLWPRICPLCTNNEIVILTSSC